MEPSKLPDHQRPTRILIQPPSDDFSEEKGIEIFKSLNIPNLQKIILSSQSIYTDLVNFAGELWNHSGEPRGSLEKQMNSSSSSISERRPSDIIILHKNSVIQGSISSPSKPKRLRGSKSLAPVNARDPHLMIEEDVQPQVASIVGESFDEKCKYVSIESQVCQLSSIANMQSLENNGKNSIVHKDISILPGLFDSVLEGESKVLEKSMENEANSDQIIGKNSSNLLKVADDLLDVGEKQLLAKSQAHYKRIPDVFEVDNQKLLKNKKKHKEKLGNALETAPDFSESDKDSLDLEEKKEKTELLPQKSIDSSFDQLYQLIPESIACQIPVLTFEEFINSLMNDESKSDKKKLWTINIFQQAFNKCWCKRLSSQDFKICEKIITFHLSPFNFQNSLHLILLFSCFRSVTKSERWPHKDKDWYEVGFESGDISRYLKQNGTISLLNIFFLSTYFPSFYVDLLRVRSYYSFNLYEIIASISDITMAILRKNKLSRLIKANGRALEVIFFFFAGVMHYWFHKLVKNKDYLKIYDKTQKKASRCMNELLKEAWRVYLENQGL